MKKVFLLTLIAGVLASCNTNSPTKAYEGVWEVMKGQDSVIVLNDSSRYVIGYSSYYDNVVITSKTMTASSQTDKYEYHYRILRDSIIELERTFLNDPTRQDYVVETKMYFNKDKHLIIENFSLGDISQIAPPTYRPVMLKRK